MTQLSHDEQPPPSAPSTGELVSTLAAQVSSLVRDELALAQVELAQKGKRVGVGAGLFGVAGILAFYGVGAALTAAGLALALVFSGWLAALIVTGAVFVLAALVAVVGKGRLSKGTPLVPARAIASSKASVEVVKEARNR